jgi:hypothetical protein
LVQTPFSIIARNTSNQRRITFYRIDATLQQLSKDHHHHNHHHDHHHNYHHHDHHHLGHQIIITIISTKRQALGNKRATALCGSSKSNASSRSITQAACLPYASSS